MTRPEHVRCENCCYWELEEVDPSEIAHGACSLTPTPMPKMGRDFCGQFRAEWPES
jgi:hypothetical protein